MQRKTRRKLYLLVYALIGVGGVSLFAMGCPVEVPPGSGGGPWQTRSRPSIPAIGAENVIGWPG